MGKVDDSLKVKSLSISNNDVIEGTILNLDVSVFRLLLLDKSTHKNIIWATNDYISFGEQYSPEAEILPELITGEHDYLIQPRSVKAKEKQTDRTRDKAEVFTPSWVCNKQNNLVDEKWFGRKNVFNIETPDGWDTIQEPISFSSAERTWQKYVDAQRLEITCGEAPYLVSRYDTVSGNSIPISDRIGLLDRKLRIVNENVQSDDEWITWTIRAYQSIFGYEFQGDNLLLARENLLVTFIDHYQNRFDSAPSIKILRSIANTIAWNIWQMDGMNFVVPYSCHNVKKSELSLFDEIIKIEPCPGCKNGDRQQHNGCYCNIQDWRTKEPVRFADMMKGWK